MIETHGEFVHRGAAAERMRAAEMLHNRPKTMEMSNRDGLIELRDPAISDACPACTPNNRVGVPVPFRSTIVEGLLQFYARPRRQVTETADSSRTGDIQSAPAHG